MLRRNFLAAAGAVLFAPAIIRTPGLLMPIKAPSLLLTGTVSDAILEGLVRKIAEKLVANHVFPGIVYCPQDLVSPLRYLPNFMPVEAIRSLG